MQNQFPSKVAPTKSPPIGFRPVNMPYSSNWSAQPTHNIKNGRMWHAVGRTHATREKSKCSAQRSMIAYRRSWSCPRSASRSAVRNTFVYNPCARYSDRGRNGHHRGGADHLTGARAENRMEAQRKSGKRCSSYYKSSVHDCPGKQTLDVPFL